MKPETKKPEDERIEKPVESEPKKSRFIKKFLKKEKKPETKPEVKEEKVERPKKELEKPEVKPVEKKIEKPKEEVKKEIEKPAIKQEKKPVIKESKVKQEKPIPKEEVPEVKVQEKIKKEQTILDGYDVLSDNVKGKIEITNVPEEYVPIYNLKMPKLERGTLALLDEIKSKIISEMRIKAGELLDPKILEQLKKKFYIKSLELIDEQLIGLSTEFKEFLAGTLVHEMLGLGKLEMILADGNLEEIVINSAKEPVWVYHKKHGWLKTNVLIPSESQVQNYASTIGRKVGRQITTLDPLLDAHLTSGDRVNATLFPISTIGNTITIRMFRRKPWTITDLIQSKTVTAKVTALIWLATQYEMNILISGGTGSGKTTFLNCLMPFIPSNQRIISIEDTRELNLPHFLHWIPLTVREPNPEGKGAISMLDLLVNSLRMRPDRIIVGEIRRERQAEVLFEAMHTGHSVYATVHADTAPQTYRRLVNPPINIPETLLEALDLVVVMFRDRKTGRRRTYQVAEFIPMTEQSSQAGTTIRILFRWKPGKDVIEKYEESYRLLEKLRMHTGMLDVEIKNDLKDKERILNWMIEKKINTVNAVGKVVAEYYKDPGNVLKIVEKNGEAEELVPKSLLEG